MRAEAENPPRLAQQDPWAVAAAAQADRARIVAHWILCARAGVRRPVSGLAWPDRVHVIALVPLGAGYFLSYLFRNVNATVAGDVTRDLQVGAGVLGLLTSIYFLAFAAAQLPVGVALDRWGPRRVQSALLAVAGLGAALCGMDLGMVGLLAGRALIGLGTAGGLVAGLKASAEWFPHERLPLVNGIFIMCGGLGALAATWPTEYALHWINWRELLLGLGGGALAVAAGVWTLVPATRVSSPTTNEAVRLADVLRDPFFRRFAPLSASCFGAVLALQGLWAGPFLAEVNGLSRPQIAADLAWMAVVLILAAPLWGVLTSTLRRGVRLTRVAGAAAALLIASEASILLPARWPSLAWCLVAAFGGMTVLSYSILAEHFPKASLGRANAALNVVHIGTAFLLQFGVGEIVALWPAAAGHSPPEAYEIGLLLPVGVQVVALSWFLWCRTQPGASPKASQQKAEVSWSGARLPHSTVVR